MHLLVAFDISDNKVRRKVAIELLKHGVRIQHSVFELRLHKHELTALTRQIKQRIELGDRLHYVPLCPKDLGARGADGLGKVYHATDYYCLL